MIFKNVGNLCNRVITMTTNLFDFVVKNALLNLLYDIHWVTLYTFCIVSISNFLEKVIFGKLGTNVSKMALLQMLNRNIGIVNTFSPRITKFVFILLKSKNLPGWTFWLEICVHLLCRVFSICERLDDKCYLVVQK